MNFKLISVLMLSLSCVTRADAPETRISPKEAKIEIGEPIKLVCYFNQPVRVAWKTPHTVLTESNYRFTLSLDDHKKTARLETKSSDKSFPGDYTCIGISNAGIKLTATASVVLYEGETTDNSETTTLPVTEERTAQHALDSACKWLKISDTSHHLDAEGIYLLLDATQSCRGRSSYKKDDATGYYIFYGNMSSESQGWTVGPALCSSSGVIFAPDDGASTPDNLTGNWQELHEHTWINSSGLRVECDTPSQIASLITVTIWRIFGTTAFIAIVIGVGSVIYCKCFRNTSGNHPSCGSCDCWRTCHVFKMCEGTQSSELRGAIETNAIIREVETLMPSTESTQEQPPCNGSTDV